MVNEAEKKKYKVGYTQGVFDMFHIGHLNLLKRSKEYCDYLIVGINSDLLVTDYKKKSPIIDQNSRRLIVENIRSVDRTIIVDTLDKTVMWELLHFDVIFIGDDWKGSSRWKKTEDELKNYGVDVVYLSYTQGVSSTELREKETNKVED